MKDRLWIPSLLLLAAAATGCAMGNTHTFDYRPPSREALGADQPVVLFAVDDRRKEIVEEGEPASWVGEQRGGYGNPFNVKTTSGRPFAEEVVETVRRDLEALGFRVVLSDRTADAVDIATALAEAGAHRGLAIEMRNFNSNTYSNIDVEWEFEATVLGAAGEPINSHRIEGRRTLEGSLLNPPKAAKEKVPPFFYELMRELVTGNAEMVRALTSG